MLSVTNMLSFVGWINGITISFKVLFDIIIGIFFIHKSKKNSVKLLIYFGLAYLLAAITFFSYFFDFITIIITGTNTINSVFYILGIVSFAAGGPTVITFTFVGIELLFNKKKKNFFITVYTLLMLIYEISFLFNYNKVLILNYPPVHGENLIFLRLFELTPQFIILVLFFISLMIFNGFGFLLKSRRTKDSVLRKRYRYLAINFFLFVLSGIFETLIKPDIYTLFTRPIFESTAVLVYYALIPKRDKFNKQKLSQKEKELASFIKGKFTRPVLKQESVKSIKNPSKLTIFISYASKDSELFDIKDIAKKLMSFDEIEKVAFYEGESYDNFIKYMNENIGKCDVLLIFCSKNALSSIPIEKEWTAADALNKLIIPIFTDQRDIPPLLSSRIGVLYDLYNMDKNVQEIRYIISKKG